MGRSFAVLVPAPQQTAATAAMLADMDRPRRDLNVRKDGSTILCHWHNHALRDEDGALDCIYANHEFARSIGRAAADVLGRYDFDLFTAEIAASLRGGVEHAIQRSRSGRPRCCARRRSGRRRPADPQRERGSDRPRQRQRAEQ